MSLDIKYKFEFSHGVNIWNRSEFLFYNKYGSINIKRNQILFNGTLSSYI